MFLSNLSIKRPILTTCVMLALTLVGLFSIHHLGVDSFPKVDIPVVTVSIAYPGASPDAVEQDVVKKVEEAVNSVEKVSEISSTSQEGFGSIVIEFDIDRDIDKALDDVRSKVGQVRLNLPSDIKEPIIQKFDPAQIPVLSLVIKPDDQHTYMTDRELTSIADEFLKRRIENISGVGKVSVVGGSTRNIIIQVNSQKLEAFGLKLEQVMSALSQNTQSIPSGNLLTKTNEISIRVDAKARLIDDFNHVIVGHCQGRPIELLEIANLIDGIKEKRSLARFNGEDIVALEIQKQLGGNTVDMVKAVDNAIKHLQPELTKFGVSIVKAKDNSKFINDSVEDVELTIILGGLLTIIIVFFFLKSWRSTIITSLTLPVSIISTFIIMKIMNFTLNTMTLMALSLAIGILIDDAIVVRENITRHIEMGKDHILAAQEGTSEIGPAVIATTLCILAVFIPVAFMGGIVGRFFFPFGIVVAFAVTVSLFVSFTLDPMLSAVWPDISNNTNSKERKNTNLIIRSVDWFNKYLDKWEIFYKKCITLALKYPKTVALIGVSSFVVSVILMNFLGKDFRPDYDRGDIQVGFRIEAGSNIDTTKNKVMELENIILNNTDGNKNREIKHIYTTIGTKFNSSVTEGNIYVKLSDEKRRDVVAIRRELRDKFCNIAGVETDISQVADFGDSKLVTLALVGPERNVVERIEPIVLNVLRNIDGVVDISSSRSQGKSELRLVMNRKVASDMGVSPIGVASLLRNMVNGSDVAKYEDPKTGEQYDVTVRMSDFDRSRISQIEAMTISSLNKNQANNNVHINLGSVAEFEETLAPPKLERRNLQPQILITANKEGRSIQEIVSDANVKLMELKKSGVIPEEIDTIFIGTAKNSKETSGHMATAMCLAIAFIYFVLASQFESFKLPIVIMVSLPLSMVGMVLMLLITGDCLSMMTSIGLILLMGLVTKNAILLVDRALQNMRDQNLSIQEALIEAGTTRLRPILMTSFAMIGGMLPMFFAIGAGSQMRAPMARAVIGGLITSTLLTLIVVPVFFNMVEELSWNKIVKIMIRKLKYILSKNHK